MLSSIDLYSFKEMLERILKPSSRDTSNVRRSMKRSREETIVPPPEKKAHVLPVAVKKEATVVKKEPLNETVAKPLTSTKVEVDVKKENQLPNGNVEFNDDVDDEMDFSMLDDDENQFGMDVPESAEIKSNEISAKAEQIKADFLRKEKENYANLLTSWENTCLNDNDEDDALLGSIDVDVASIATNVDNKSTMKFWYWDAYEDPNKFPGKVFLFGRMPMENNPREFKSVCITIENVERSLFLLPRKYALDPNTWEETSKEVTMGDVYQEFNDYCPHTFKSKRIEKHFAFNVPGVKVPQTSEYLQVRVRFHEYFRAISLNIFQNRLSTMASIQHQSQRKNF